MIHKCKQLQEAKPAFWGHAVTDITYDEEHKCWEMNNWEYSSFPIICCPFCGDKLKSPKEEKNENN